MAKDYANRQRPKKMSAQTKAPKKQRKLGRRTLCLVVTITLILYGYYFVDLRKIEKKVVSVLPIPGISVEVPKPHFEFYSQHSDKKINPHNVIHKPTPQLTTAKAKNNSYLLQVGSFKTYGDADSLKAKLLLLGFDVKVSKFSNGTNTWHRVYVGPYRSLAQAKQVQLAMEEKNLTSLIKIS